MANSTVMEQSTPSTKQLTSSTKGRTKRKNPCQHRSRCGGQVKKIQKGIKRLLHGSARKKFYCIHATIPRKAKRVERAKKF
ncbi:spermatid nuclear transition protein 3 [Manis javanica]|uniref:spermatid nuclear transition protein 3 n=1 Tax=Manis javanica TaxID=9974 RepID=UPI003C6D78E7